MKKTRVIGVDISEVNKAIKKLEDEGWEVVNFKNIKLSNGEVYILLMAQKEVDKSIYEKMYLLEQYCFNYHSEEERACKGCKLEKTCSEYIGESVYHWDFEDVKKAYGVIRDDI